MAAVTCYQSVPHLKWKLVKGYLAYSERTPSAQPWRILDQMTGQRLFATRTEIAATVRDEEVSCVRRASLARQQRRHRGSLTDPTLKVSFRQKLSVRI